MDADPIERAGRAVGRVAHYVVFAPVYAVLALKHFAGSALYWTVCAPLEKWG